eukprot:3229613-Pyramimonas_sp.AAC.3
MPRRAAPFCQHPLEVHHKEAGNRTAEPVGAGGQAGRNKLPVLLPNAHFVAVVSSTAAAVEHLQVV